MTFSSRHPYAMSSASGDVPGRPRCQRVCVCVEWERDLWRQKQTLWHPHFNPALLEGPASPRRQPLWKHRWWKRSRQRDVRFETWLFCLYVNQQAFLRQMGNDKEMTHHEWQFVSGLNAFDILSSYICTIEHDEWYIFQSKSQTEPPPTHTPNGSSACHKWLIRCSFFAWKDRVTLPLSLPSISAYLGV